MNVRALVQSVLWFAVLFPWDAGGEPTSAFALGEEADRVVWIYRDVPGEGASADPRTEEEKLMLPFYLFPQAPAAKGQIRVDYRCDLKSIDAEGAGTCIKLSFEADGPEWFAGVAFTPGGRAPGENTPGRIDVNRLLRLGGDSQSRVVLRFRARSSAGGTPRVIFQVGGQKGDGLESPVKPKRTPTTLSDNWADYEIDVTGRPGELRSVVCPLCILVRADQNTVRSLTVFVDDVRFEVLRPKK
jgi:hypothetical protein